MKKHLNPLNITIAICIVIVATAIYFFFFLKKTTSNIDINSMTSNSTTIIPNDSYPLRRNSAGNRVKALQAALNYTYHTNLDIDGEFGQKTEAACLKSLGTTSVSETLMRSLFIPVEYINYI